MTVIPAPITVDMLLPGDVLVWKRNPSIESCSEIDLIVSVSSSSYPKIYGIKPWASRSLSVIETGRFQETSLDNELLKHVTCILRIET